MKILWKEPIKGGWRWKNEIVEEIDIVIEGKDHLVGRKREAMERDMNQNKRKRTKNKD